MTSSSPVCKQKRMGRGTSTTVTESGRGMPLDFVDQRSGQVKRSPNAFILFSTYLRLILKQKLPSQSGKQPVNIQRTIGALWKCMTKSQRKPFQDKAEELNLKHRKIFPNSVHIHNHVVCNHSVKDKKQVLSDQTKRWAIPIAIQPLPGPVSPVKVPTPIELPWCDRGRRPNPTPTLKEKSLQNTCLKEVKKVVITDPTKVKFRVVSKYRPSKYIPTFKKKKERETRRNQRNQVKAGKSSSSYEVPKTKIGHRADQESVCSLDEIPDESILNCALDIEALLQDVSFPENFYGDCCEQDVQFSNWFDRLSPTLNQSDLCDQDVDEPKRVNDSTQLCPDDCDLYFNPDNWIESSILLLKNSLKSQDLPQIYSKEDSKNSQWWQEFDFMCSPNESSVEVSPVPRKEDCLPEDSLSVLKVCMATTYSEEVETISTPEPGDDDRLSDPFELQCSQKVLEEQTVSVYVPNDQMADINRKQEQQYGMIDSVKDDEDYCEARYPENTESNTYTPLETVALSQESVLDFSYSTTPTWESMVNLTPSVIVDSSTKIFTSSSETSVSDSRYLTDWRDSSVVKSENPLLDESSEVLFRSSTPIPPASNNDGMSPATSQLINYCLDDESAPFLSPFLSGMACMTSPIESSFSSRFADISEQSTSSDRYVSQSELSYSTPITIGAKGSRSGSSGCHMITDLAPPRKRARRSLSQPNLSLQATFTPYHIFRSPSPSPESINPSKFSPRKSLQTPTKGRRLPSITADDAQRMMSGFETHEHRELTEFEYLQSRQTCLDSHDPIEKANAVEALLKEHF